MSTYWYYECVNHDPPLRSDDEFTQHTGDRHYLRGLELADSRPVIVDERYWTAPWLGMSDDDISDAYFTTTATSFLSLHPECVLRVVDEYGNYAEEDS